MTFLTSEELLSHISSIIHADTQSQKNHIDLTLAGIHGIKSAGSLDFGGSEFQSADKQSLDPKKKNAEDDYGWWHLQKGTYQAAMNEKVDIEESTIAIVGPHIHTQETGIVSNTRILTARENAQAVTLNFQVPDVGCNIKENARFAVLYIIKLD